jgi:hypothetical protein
MNTSYVSAYLQLQDNKQQLINFRMKKFRKFNIPLGWENDTTTILAYNSTNLIALL